MATKEQRQVIQAIKDLGGVANAKDIAEIIETNYATIRSVLTRMKAKGILKQVRRGEYALAEQEEDLL